MVLTGAGGEVPPVYWPALGEVPSADSPQHIREYAESSRPCYGEREQVHQEQT